MNATKALQKLLKDKDVDIKKKQPNNEITGSMLVEQFNKRLTLVRYLVEKSNKNAVELFDVSKEVLARLLNDVCKFYESAIGYNIYSKLDSPMNVGVCKRNSLDIMTMLQAFMILSVYDTTNDSKEKAETLIDLLHKFFEDDDGENEDGDYNNQAR